tara:strand:- start:5229 stop:14444 length:9216 start_codon:yes stop_codon:yes gene_type:complete
MENNIVINTVDPQTFEFQDYSTSDETLIANNELDTAFTGSTDYIEAYIYDENKNIQTSQVPFTNYKVTEGNVVLTPSNDLERLGFDIGSYYISYDFYRPRLASTLNTQYYISEISSDRTEIRLDSTQINNELLISSSLEFIAYRDKAEYFVDFLLNFGNNQQVIANNIELDLEDENNPTILIKLYESLPAVFSNKSLCSVVEQISTPQSYNVTFPPIDFTPDDFTYISGPNYSLNIKGQSGTPGMDFSYNTLVASDLTSSFNQVNSLLNRKEIDINVNYEDYNDFIYFSSAYTRLQNFYHKVGIIQSASLQLGKITSSTTGSTIYSSSQAVFSNTIETTIKNFDGYEYFLYFDSGSKDSYPKSNTKPPFALYPTGSTETLTWLGSTDDSSAYFGGQAVSSSNFDEDNQNSLYYAIPEYLRSDIQNAKYELFVDMVGQHYDNLWMYTKNITTRFDADNRLDYGISKDMVADAIRDFGVKLYSNNFNTNDLYTTFLGLTPSGSSFPFPNMTGSIGGVVATPPGYEYVDSTISASNDIVPLDDVNKRLYKRIYHNIPYLLKTKGTVAGLRALITSYGIPDTILRINEFGGKDRNNSQDWDLKQDFYNVGLNTTSSAFTSSFNLATEFEADENSPGAIQFRFKTNGIPSASNTPITQSFFYSSEGAGSKIAMAIEYNESLLLTGSYSGSTESKFKNYGTLKFWPNEVINPTNYASLYLPFWDGDWWSVQINRKASDGKFELLAANALGENLGFTGSDEISADTQKWELADQIFWLPQTYTEFDSKYYFPFSGSLQEVRYFSEPISESVFFDYTMNPYSFEGNSINSAPNQLAFRLPLGTMLKTGSFNTSIHPKVTGSWVTTGSFRSDIASTASFSATPTWLNNVEDIYPDQSPSGMRNRVTDKIQTEAMILPEGDTLSGYRSIQQTSYVSESFTPSVNYLEVAFSPQDQINDDITSQLGYFNIGEYIGDPRLISSSDKSYPDLDLLRDAYFEKYITNYNVTDFVRLIKFFDNSLFKMIEDFTPARTSLSSGVVVKQHLLERNRQRPAQVTSSFEQYSGSVRNLPKNYSLGSTDYPQYSDSGSAIYKFSGGTGGGFEPFNGLKTYPSGSENLGPNNRYFLTQSWDESWSTLTGSAPIDRTDQREFYNGEFSGSNIQVGIKDICSAYFKVSNTSYRYIPVFWSSDGNNNTGKFSEQTFLEPNNQPPAGYVWFWQNGNTFTAGNTATGNILYIKMSLETYNGINIAPFIQGVEFVTFQFNTPIDVNGNILLGRGETFYLESVAIQPANLSQNAQSVGAALAFTVPALSSTMVSSNDAAFYDFNFSASGDFIWTATDDTTSDPDVVLNTGVSASVPQGYFPLPGSALVNKNFPTESFFRGWASSNYYENGTFISTTGLLSDPLDNFNTGSHEIDNTDTTLQSGIDPASNFPWFMNASQDAQGSSWIKIQSSSFLDYSNIPDSTVGPVSTNNYFTIGFTSASSAQSPAIQGTNYYYNASNNAIYMSGSSFQNELKEATPLYSSSLVAQIIPQGSSTTSYTPPGQTSLSIPLAPDNELWVYQGENSSLVNAGGVWANAGVDKNAWRYNRYVHRPFKIYYLTETGSGAPSTPYELYDPMSSDPTTITSSGVPQSVPGAPRYYDSVRRQFATMLGTQTDYSLLTFDYWRVLNGTSTAPSVTQTSGSFDVYNDDRQVRPFIFTTYQTRTPGGIGPAIGSGSAISISQSDGTPFATLRMYQNEAAGGGSNLVPIGMSYRIVCSSASGCILFYLDEDGSTVGPTYMVGGQILDVCGDATVTTTSVILPTSNGNLSITASPSQLLSVCTQNTQTGGGSGQLASTSYVNSNPYFYDLENNQGNTKQSPAAIAAGTYEILFGELYDGENTSSLSLLTGTQPAGDIVTPDIIFPKGNYIFTMSDFDTGRFSNGRTEFGLWTSYGDYANYIFENQSGSGQNPVTIDYINTSYNQDTVDVYNLAATKIGNGMTADPGNGGAQNVGTAMSFSGQIFYTDSRKFQRINIEVGGVYNIDLLRSNFNSSNSLKLYVSNDQTNTGPVNSIDGLPVYEIAFGVSSITTTLTLTAGQQLVLYAENGINTIFGFNNIYNTSLDSNVIQAALGSPTAQTPFNEPFVITGSIGNRYIGGAPVPAGFATKITDAYIVYSSSATSSLAGSYIFDVTPTYGLIALTASVLVKSFSGTSTSALYGSANYGTEDYGGGFATGGTTWTTASLIIYSGSANSFPNLMPELGGDIFFRKDSYSTNHASGTRITIEENILPAQLEYNTVLKMALLVSSGSSAPSVVQSSLIVTEYSMSFSSSIDTDIDPSIPTVFSDDSNFDLALDCQPLLNNYSDGRLNDRLQDIDYNFGTVTPSNWQQIIEFSASKASVPESNYTIRASANPRYFGTRTDSARINAWTPGDIGGYGKLPNVEISRGFLGYFKSTTDLYPLLNNSTQYNIQYLIGQDGVATQPKLSDISLYNMQGTFDSYPEVSKGIVALNQKSDSEVLTSLDGTIIFKKVTQRPVPIIYTQKSNLFPLSSSYDGGGVYEGEGLDMIGSEPVDSSIVPSFANFGFLAESLDAGSEGTTFTDTFNATQKTPTSNTTPNITSSFVDNSITYQVYDTSAGTIRIPNTDGYPDSTAGGNGKSTSQDYDLDFSIGIDTTPLTYVVQTSNPNKGGNFNSSPNVGSFNIKPQRTNNQGPTSTAFNTFIPSSVNVIVTNFYLQADGTELTTTINYRQVASSLVNITGAGITVTFNSNVIKNAISNTGQPSTAVQEGGNLLKQRWTVSGQLTGTSIKQGRNFRFTGTGNMIVLTATGRDVLKDPKFFPTQQSGKIETRISLDGAESNPVTAAIPPYWIFKDTVGDGTGTKIANTLMMSSSQMNKAYGRGFIQKDLIYTSSLNKDFPDGIEPSFATFPTIQTPWDIQPYDEIRFRGNEDYNYVVTSVRTPAQQLTASYIQDGVGMLEVTLDRNVPLSFDNITTATPGGIGVALDVKATSSLYSGDIEGTIIPVFKKVNYSIQTFRPLDFFLVRRYVEDASSLITFQQYPYGNPPVSQSVSGFISPEYPTAQLKTNPDDILSDLIDKKLIE